MQIPSRYAAGLVAMLALLFLLATLPARLVGYGLPQEVRLAGITGTLWHGAAARASVDVFGKTVHLGALNWSLKPWSLLLLSPDVSVSSRWGSQNLSGRVASGVSGRVSLSNLDGSIDTRFLRELLPLYVGGELQFQAVSAVLALDESIDVKQLSGRVLWQEAVWAASMGDVALGNYVLDWGEKEGPISAQLLTLSGPLELAGQVALEGNRYRVDITLRGPAVRNTRLSDSFQLLAAPVAGGFDLKLDGNF